MTQRIVIVGSGFAGMWSALSAARALDKAGKTLGQIEIAVIAPEPILSIRPRFYESDPSAMTAPLTELFDAVGVRYVQGRVANIDTDNNNVEVVSSAESRFTMSYDRVVLAMGSRLFRPALPGLQEHSHSIDQLQEAAELKSHLLGLANLPDTPARNTVVVAGGGFTGIEIAAEMPARLRSILGNRRDIKVIIVEQAGDIGPDLGPGPRPVIEHALEELGVTSRLNCAVTSIDAGGLFTCQGERIATRTVIWTCGLRASSLTQKIPSQRDRLGRLHVDSNLRVPGIPNVFATGDVAFAACDEQGNHALMSCQHAMNLGRSAGNNAAADLLGLSMRPYTQPKYTTCLDLGPWGAVLTEGWHREVKSVGAEAKALKRRINGQAIYPRRADRAEVFAAADPARVLV